ncbi:MAG: site-specific integrase [Gemmataceae bacterium]|nr:site-specific integrase [Gemmataceae bacterium]
MPRKPSVWFREQDGFYYTTVRGQQTKLSRDKAEADRAFHRLMADAPEPVPANSVTFRRVADTYLAVTKQTKAENTFVNRLKALRSFCKFVGNKRAADLKVADVTNWLLATPTWGHNTQVMSRAIVRTCLNWAVEQGYLADNPLRRLKCGSFHGRERILTREERDGVRRLARRQNFKDYLSFLELTGSRPYSEAAAVTAAQIDFAAGTITLEKHKNARKGKRRVIYLTPELEALLKRLAAAKPKGHLFVTSNGLPYSGHNIGHTLNGLADKLGIKRFAPYAYRHTYITEALERGLSSDIVARLVGNTPRTINKYYDHLQSKKDSLREAAAKAIS